MGKRIYKQMIWWPVMPICDNQLKDVRKEDLLFDGLYRSCNTYRGGGGYDEFGNIYERRFGITPEPVQFVVQLKGCPLNCPYCYVTPDGIHGNSVMVNTNKLLDDYESTGLKVFHLMGGAPAIYLEHWKNLTRNFKKDQIFHSDFLLVENLYKPSWLIDLPGLHAVSFKEKYLYNKDQLGIMWKNLRTLIDCKVNFYITFTGRDEFSHKIYDEFGPKVLEDSFLIKIQKYKALWTNG